MSDYTTALLNSIKEIIHNDVKGSDDFNIFKVLAVEYREIYFCRFIGELLDPRGSHGADILPLKLFFKYVLEEDINSILPSVRLEETIEDNRRVDIVIYDGSKIYPIEVKIFAGDQNSQLSDYHKSYFKNSNGVIYYLTPDKHKPSESSRGDLKEDQIKCISFAEISKWLNALCEEKDFKQKDICRQFKNVVDNIMEGYKMSVAVVNKVFEKNNKENINAALAIIKEKDNILEKIKCDFICELKKIIEIIDEGKYTCDYENKPSKDKRRRLKISRGNITIGYICIESNLYITTDRNHEGKWKDQTWTYIDYGSDHFNFKDNWHNVILFAYGNENDKNKNQYKMMKDTLKDTLKDILNNISDEKQEVK